MRYYLRLSFLAFLLATCLAGSATAQVTFGLDRGTRDLINQLPENIRASIIKTLNEALPLIDKSVTSYLVKVDKIIKENIAAGATAVQCSSVGAAKIIETEISTSLANIIYTAKRKGLNAQSIGNYTEAFSDAISEARKNITTATKGNDVSIAYSDLLIRGAIIKCATNINPALLQNEIDAQIRRISVPSLEWNTLIPDRDRPYCNKVHECAEKRREDIRKYIEEADANDLSVSKAKILLDTVPPTPKLPKSTVFGYPSIQILDYEQILVSLREVERAVEAAKSTRLARAQSALSSAATARDAAKQLYNSAEGNRTHPTSMFQDNRDAVDRYPQIVNLSNTAIASANEAMKGDAATKVAAEEIVKLMNENIALASKMRATAQATLNALERATVERLRAERIERRIVR